jgi:hypothetical protein
MTAMLKSQHGLSDQSLLARSQLWATRLLPVVHAALGTGRPIVDAGRLMVVRIHIARQRVGWREAQKVAASPGRLLS